MWEFCIYSLSLCCSCPKWILLCGQVNDLVLLVTLLGVPGTVIVSQVVERLNLIPMVSPQHWGGLLEPLCLRGCCGRLSLNLSEKGGEMMEYGQWWSLLQWVAPLPLLWQDRVFLSHMDLSQNLVVPPLAALHVSHAATMRTLYNRRRMALSLVSLFHLVVHYNDLTFDQSSYTAFRISSCFLAPMSGRMKM